MRVRGGVSLSGGVCYTLSRYLLVAWGCRGGANRLVHNVGSAVLRGLRGGDPWGLWCFWAWVTQQPRPEPLPRGTLRRRRGLLAPGDVTRLLTRHRETPLAARAVGPCGRVAVWETPHGGARESWRALWPVF